MALLSKKQILEADDLETRVVPVPEWGGEVIVSSMTAKMKDDYEATIATINSDGSVTNSVENIRAKLLAATIVDESGKPMFTTSDIEKLGSKSVKAIDRVFTVAAELNAVSESDIEELAKNS